MLISCHCTSSKRIICQHASQILQLWTTSKWNCSLQTLTSERKLIRKHISVFPFGDSNTVDVSLIWKLLYYVHSIYNIYYISINNNNNNNKNHCVSFPQLWIYIILKLSNMTFRLFVASFFFFVFFPKGFLFEKVIHVIEHFNIYERMAFNTDLNFNWIPKWCQAMLLRHDIIHKAKLTIDFTSHLLA